MAEIPFLTLAALITDVDDAGSGNRLNLTINVAGTDVAIAEFVEDRRAGRGGGEVAGKPPVRRRMPCPGRR
jgi:hypothetical protein